MISDGQGRELWLGAIRPGRMHDVTQIRTEGTEEQFRLHPNVKAEVDAGYLGLVRDFAGQVSGPPKKPGEDAGPSEHHAYEYARRHQSSRRIMVEHAPQNEWTRARRAASPPNRPCPCQPGCRSLLQQRPRVHAADVPAVQGVARGHRETPVRARNSPRELGS